MNNIHDEREQGKIGLKSYLDDFNFPDMELTFKKTIKEVNSEIKKAREAHETYSKRERASELDEFDFYCLEDNIFYWQERLLSIYEMIIISDFKELEIILKELLGGALGYKSQNKSFFDNAKNFLKEKGIVLSEVKYYNDIDDLRIINNHIKHSGAKEIPKELKHIKELRKADKFSFPIYSAIHHRVKNKRIAFVLDLKNKIHSYLYDFDDAKISTISRDILIRMDEKHVSILVQKLVESINPYQDDQATPHSPKDIGTSR